MADILTLPWNPGDPGSAPGLQRAFLLWSSVVLLLGSTSLILVGMSAFGYLTVAALRRRRPLLAFSFSLVAWLPLALQTCRRLAFVVEYRALDRPDGYGSPVAFLVGLIFEQMLFLPLSAMIALLWWRSRRSRAASAAS